MVVGLGVGEGGFPEGGMLGDGLRGAMFSGGGFETS